LIITNMVAKIREWGSNNVSWTVYMDRPVAKTTLNPLTKLNMIIAYGTM